ncbi:MAG TPA: hypothetical protein VHM91_13475 [Verrucomicrobiales bacterium]|jgi:autotransporter-associated beta strand protein|nr:hypothetical protein [Verrucomicrobiales bacterium]
MVTGFLITNPGEGYTSAPAITVYNGRAHGITGLDAAAGAPVLSPNATNSPLRKTGAGILTLDSALNSWTGPISVEEGLLRMNGLFPSSSVTMKPGTQLIGGGQCGTVTLQDAILSPGTGGFTSGGALYTGSVTAGGASVFAFSLHGTVPGGSLNGDYDQLVLTGSVQLAQGTILSVLMNGTFQADAGQVFYLLVNDGVDAIAGTFDHVAEGSVITNEEGERYLVTYRANAEGGSFTGGNDLAVKYLGQAGPPPVLQIAKTAPSGGLERVRISWPKSAEPEWKLQTSPAMTAGTWAASGLNVQSDAAEYYAIDSIPAGTTRRYYRLKLQ